MLFMSDIKSCPNCSDGGIIQLSGGCATCMMCGFSACPSG